jgi:hypothetical protein
MSLLPWKPGEHEKGRACLLKKLGWCSLKFVLVFLMIVSSSLAIYMRYKGATFDPIREIQTLKSESRRDDALDIARFFKENQINDQRQFAQIEKDLEYTAAEKVKSFVWNGAIRGQVYDSYSGMGAISADLCVIGDIRDLGIQGWKYLTGSQDFDGVVTILSAAGIGLSTTPFLDGTNALAKNILKYLKKVPASINKGLLQKFLFGKVSPENCKKIWDLLKKTAGPFLARHPAYHKFTALNI